jgi:hypothetical protein
MMIVMYQLAAMSPRRRSWASKAAIAVSIAAIGIAVSPRDAAAARIPVIYQSGHDAFPCGPLPPPYDHEPGLAGFQAGYVCEITGVFWTYFSVRDCKPAAIHDDVYKESPELAAAIQARYPESTMQRGIWNHYGWMAMAALFLFGLIVWIKDAIAGKAD